MRQDEARHTHPLPDSCRALQEKRISRRDFLASSAFLGGSALLASKLNWAFRLLQRAEAGHLTAGEAYELAKAQNVLYSVCLQCHTACTNKAKILDGVLVKLDGNPYGPTMLPHIRYATAPGAAATIDGKLCPKGQAGIQTLYDPYRIRKVLKRSGPRGSNRWQTISFDQAIDEIVNGGLLFKHVPGEENRRVPGLKDLYALRDPDLARRLARDAKKVGKGQMKLATFRQKYAEHLHLLEEQPVHVPGRPHRARPQGVFPALAQRWLRQHQLVRTHQYLRAQSPRGL